jgi:hypothetical protein
MIMTPIYMAPPAYLLVGCLLMLALNELLYGAVTRRELVMGMILWPLLLLGFVEALLASLLQRLRG